MEYNSFGQLISDYQEHAAVVSVGTSPKVGDRYDRLHRLVDFDRGKLIRDDDLIDPLARKAQWTLDATGNWSRVWSCRIKLPNAWALAFLHRGNGHSDGRGRIDQCLGTR